MEKIYLDLYDEEKVSVVKEKARQTIINDIMEFLKERYEDARFTASNEIGVKVGCAKDEEGGASDLIVSIKCSTRNWYNKMDCKRPVERYVLEDEAKAYEDEVAAKKAPKK